MKKRNPNIPHSTPKSSDPTESWHVIREYNSNCTWEDLVRIVIRRHLELIQEESGHTVPCNNPIRTKKHTISNHETNLFT